MFKRVLVATDFSAYTDLTLGCIGQLSGMEEVLLAHVVNGTQLQDGTGYLRNSHVSSREVALAGLEEKQKLLRQMTGVTVSTRIVEAPSGDIASAIIQLAHAENISLIVMGGRGKGLLSGFILGSVSEGVARRSTTDVLIMHFPGSKDNHTGGQEKSCRNVFSHVLCPVDFSKPSEKTLEYALSLSCIRRITLLHVMDPKTPRPDREKHPEEPHQKLEEIDAALARRGIRGASLIRTGNPAREIVRAAGELDVSLIMIARFGQSDYIKNIPIGSVAAAIVNHAERPVFIVNPHISLSLAVKELETKEFPLAEEIWTAYHQQKADPVADRVFGAFIEGTLVSAARCRRHPDGFEVDAVYTPVQFRGRGYARLVVQALVNACGNEPLYMHSTLDLTGFYGTFGFIAIREHELPPTIRERFSFAGGDLKGANVQPMLRPQRTSMKKPLS